MHSPYEVNIHNWHTNANFVDFLKLSYSLSAPTLEAVSKLLPIAVAEDRMLESLRNKILSEAMAIWNAPLDTHFFLYSPTANRWMYKGVDKARAGQVSISLYGRLREPLVKGRFCDLPRNCMIQAIVGMQFPY